MPKGHPITDLRAHFESLVIIKGDHWGLDAVLNNKGYHVISVGGGQKAYGHRVSYVLHVGPIADGLEIDHKCRVTWCCRPDHLEAVTHGENQRRAHPVCGAGLHDMTDPANYYQRKNGGRMCKPCNDRRNRARFHHPGGAKVGGCDGES